MGLNRLVSKLKKTTKAIIKKKFQLQTPKIQVLVMKKEPRMSQNGEKSNLVSHIRPKNGLQANFKTSIALQPVKSKA